MSTIPDGIDDTTSPRVKACSECYPHPIHAANLCEYCLCSRNMDPDNRPVTSGGELLKMAETLDAMDTDVTSWEAGFLDSTLKALRAGWTITAKQEHVLRDMHAKYIE